MHKISEDFFQHMSIRHIWGYLEHLQDNNEKMEDRIFELYHTIWKLDAENQKLKEQIDYYRNVSGIVPWTNQLNYGLLSPMIKKSIDFDIMEKDLYE